jgi:hypothetical protein
MIILNFVDNHKKQKMLKILRLRRSEGISALLLFFFFAMPMKYFFNDPIYVKQIGMAHGVLLAYCFGYHFKI